MRPKTRSAMAAGKSAVGVITPSSRNVTDAAALPHVKMNITGPGALGLLHEALQDLRRGLLGVRQRPRPAWCDV